MFRNTENMQRDGLERNMLMHLTLSTGNDVLLLNSAVLLFNSEKCVKGLGENYVNILNIKNRFFFGSIIKSSLIMLKKCLEM